MQARLKKQADLQEHLHKQESPAQKQARLKKLADLTESPAGSPK